MKVKRPTQKEKIAVYEDLLHELQFHMDVTLDNDKIKAILARIASWSYAHRQGNGELSEDQQHELIDNRFWNLDIHKRHVRKESP
jgi:hypothetical protein